ncbi:unnamed protein product [Effrenium voratum]|uniref:Uncharacterized protein n=1 Tax=Effrenium voratum TaxID=2562239 RepID=A0AA36I7U0_9DINO|nr:unnamed protein product [Effrenium voratum]CAJ1426203.1 unnamed protein product [Effrenium voratum]
MSAYQDVFSLRRLRYRERPASVVFQGSGQALHEAELTALAFPSFARNLLPTSRSFCAGGRLACVSKRRLDRRLREWPCIAVGPARMSAAKVVWVLWETTCLEHSRISKSFCHSCAQIAVAGVRVSKHPA